MGRVSTEAWRCFSRLKHPKIWMREMEQDLLGVKIRLRAGCPVRRGLFGSKRNWFTSPPDQKSILRCKSCNRLFTFSINTLGCTPGQMTQHKSLDMSLSWHLLFLVVCLSEGALYRLSTGQRKGCSHETGASPHKLMARHSRPLQPTKTTLNYGFFAVPWPSH